MAQLEILDYTPCVLGTLCLRRRELLSRPGFFVTEMTLNHELLMTSLHTASERALATRAGEMHAGSELSALVGGLGLGYTAHELLQNQRIARLECVELLAPVIDWYAQDLIPLARDLKADRRFEVRQGDVYARLAGPVESRFDLILIDVDHAPDERLGGENAAFYTEQGLRRAREHLAPGGVLAVWSYAESSPFADALRAVFKDVRVEGVRFENTLIDKFETDWLFLVCG